MTRRPGRRLFLKCSLRISAYNSEGIAREDSVLDRLTSLLRSFPELLKPTSGASPRSSRPAPRLRTHGSRASAPPSRAMHGHHPCRDRDERSPSRVRGQRRTRTGAERGPPREVTPRRPESPEFSARFAAEGRKRAGFQRIRASGSAEFGQLRGVLCPPPSFKTGAFDHSAIPPLRVWTAWYLPVAWE